MIRRCDTQKMKCVGLNIEINGEYTNLLEIKVILPSYDIRAATRGTAVETRLQKLYIHINTKTIKRGNSTIHIPGMFQN